MRRNSFSENIQCLQMQDAHLAETRQSLGPIRPEHQQRQREDQQFEGGENFDFYVDWKTGWRYHREPGRTPPAACSSSTSQWQASQSQTSWSSWYPTSSEKWWWFRFPGRNSRKSTDGVDRDTHSQYTSVQYTLFTSAERTHNALGSRIAYHLCAPKSVVIWCVSCLILGCSLTRLLPWALPLFHLSIQPHTENTQYIAHLQAPSVDMLRNQKSLWREDLHSGGNPRTRSPTHSSPNQTKPTKPKM